MSQPGGCVGEVIAHALHFSLPVSLLSKTGCYLVFYYASSDHWHKPNMIAFIGITTIVYLNYSFSGHDPQVSVILSSKLPTSDLFFQALLQIHSFYCCRRRQATNTCCQSPGSITKVLCAMQPTTILMLCKLLGHTLRLSNVYAMAMRNRIQTIRKSCGI